MLVWRSQYMNIAFSTSWAGGDIDRVLAILPHIDTLEIGSKGDSGFFTDLEDLIRNDGVRVTSVHAIAYPGKEESEAYYAPRLASLDESVRSSEIEEICNTAEWSLQLGANALVIHTGKVEDEDLKTMCLAYKRYRSTGQNPVVQRELFHEVIARRNMLSKPYLESIIEGLNVICSIFPELSFYIETRVHYYEIPLPDELDTIFNTVRHPNLGYWHDIGHTHMLDFLGFVEMKTWQSRFSNRCGGVHIHDVDEDLLDHFPPGEGVLDIHSILAQFDDVLFTLEINARNDFESVIRGIKYLRTDRICV
jgi:sugar phosphate isomerase/epimerase